MSAEDRVAQSVVQSAMPPPLPYSATLHWDGMEVTSRNVGLSYVPAQGAHSAVPVQWQPAAGCRARLPVTTRPMCLIPSPPPQAIDYDQAAACLTFYLAPRLLLATVYDVLCGATGVLVWVRQAGHEECITPAARPVLLVRVAYEALQVDHVEFVPHLPTCAPLCQHITLALQAQGTADGVAGHLYAEFLANTLAVHLLRRYAACRQPGRESPARLSPSKLRRVTAYIQAHLEHELPLVTLAAVAQTSPAHFWCLFKQATRQTPHQHRGSAVPGQTGLLECEGQRPAQSAALFATLATELDAYADLLTERVAALGGVVRGTVRTAATQSTLPEYPDTIVEENDHVCALA